MARTKATEATKKAADTIKTSAKKVADKVPASTKESAKKAVTDAKTTVKTTAKKARTTAKKLEPVQETFFEFEGQQIMAEEIVAKIKEAYKAEGHRVSSIKSLRTYINPYERKAYYVINEKVEDKYVEF